MENEGNTQALSQSIEQAPKGSLPLESLPTDPATLPDDIKAKLLSIREALVNDDVPEAWHHLYSIACPTFGDLDPWAKLEGRTS